MGKIVVSRKQEWTSRLRQFGLYVDGHKLDTIATGDVKTFEIPDGNHSLKAKIDWYGSREIDFSIFNEEKKYFTVSVSRNYKITMVMAFALFLFTLVLRRVYHVDFGIWLAILIILFFIYYLTLGRNDFLTLQQTESW